MILGGFEITSGEHGKKSLSIILTKKKNNNKNNKKKTKNLPSVFFFSRFVRLQNKKGRRTPDQRLKQKGRGSIAS